MSLPENDISLVDFGDIRLTRRLKESVEAIRKNAGKSILGAGKGRSQAKAFYRLLSNEKFDFAQMQESVRDSTLSRISEAGGTVLLIQDTTEINLNGHKKTEGLGYSSEYVKGVRLHSCIAVSQVGIPFGLVGQEYETRSESKSKLSKAEKANRSIEEKESYRWLKMLEETTRDMPKDVTPITICDREGDFYELYAESKRLDADFIIRVTHDRSSLNNEKVVSKLRKSPAFSQISINIPRNSRRNRPARQTEMEIAYSIETIKKPMYLNEDDMPEWLQVNFVRVTELTPVAGEEPIEWILATSLPLFDQLDVMTIVEYYVQRWKIERFHFVLKSGMNAEKIQQRTYERIKPVLLIYSVVALYIMAITFLGRTIPDMPCDLLFDEDEWKILYRIANNTKTPPDTPYSIAEAIQYLGQLGGYKRSPSDGEPGLKVIWTGLTSLYFAIELLVGQV